MKFPLERVYSQNDKLHKYNTRCYRLFRGSLEIPFPHPPHPHIITPSSAKIYRAKIARRQPFAGEAPAWIYKKCHSLKNTAPGFVDSTKTMDLYEDQNAEL